MNRKFSGRPTSQPLVLAILVLLFPLTLRAAEPAKAKPQPAAAMALDRYLAKPDNSYRWVKRAAGTVKGVEFAELILTSQTWRNIAWKHQLYILKPTTATAETTHALLFISGGRWKDEYADPDRPISLPDEAELFADMAERMKTPVAILRQVPMQPMFGGKVEDQIIALTFENYLESGDDEWPLLLPMVKSAVRAMDAIGEFGKQEWEIGLKTFTVTGASKRGWTTWLTGASDKRATAIAPMVIDVLNMRAHLAHQKEVWGSYSYQIEDYTDRGIQNHLASKEGKSLRAIVDPYSYCDRLTQLKLIIIGTNDHYWPIDSLNLYWNDLTGPKYILYVPNNRHGLKDYDRVLGTLNALQQQAANGYKLPDLSWKFTPNSDGTALSITSNVKPRRVSLWSAAADKRDFRESKWTSKEIAPRDGRFTVEMPTPASGAVALFGEAVYEVDGVPFYLSTNVRVLTAGKATVVGE